MLTGGLHISRSALDSGARERAILCGSLVAQNEVGLAIVRVDIGGGIRLFVDIEGPQLVPDGPRMAERPVLILLHGGPGPDHSVFKPSSHALPIRRSSSTTTIADTDAATMIRSRNGRWRTGQTMLFDSAPH
jgi:hypothetical protein